MRCSVAQVQSLSRLVGQGGDPARTSSRVNCATLGNTQVVATVKNAPQVGQQTYVNPMSGCGV